MYPFFLPWWNFIFTWSSCFLESSLLVWGIRVTLMWYCNATTIKTIVTIFSLYSVIVYKDREDGDLKLVLKSGVVVRSLSDVRTPLMSSKSPPPPTNVWSSDEKNPSGRFQRLGEPWEENASCQEVSHLSLPRLCFFGYLLFLQAVTHFKKNSCCTIRLHEVQHCDS